METSRLAPLDLVPPGLHIPAMTLPLLGALGEATWHEAASGSGWTAPKVPLLPRVPQSHPRPSLIVALDDSCDELCIQHILKLDAARARLNLDGKPLSLTFISLSSNPPAWGKSVFMSQNPFSGASLQSRLLSDVDEVFRERLSILQVPMSFLVSTDGELIARGKGFPVQTEQESIFFRNNTEQNFYELTKNNNQHGDSLVFLIFPFLLLALGAALFSSIRYMKNK